MKNYEDLEKVACDSMACLAQAVLEGIDVFPETGKRMGSAKRSLHDGIVDKICYERILSEQNALRQQAKENVLQEAKNLKDSVSEIIIEAFTPNLFSMTHEMSLSLLAIDLDVREAGHLIWDHLKNFTAVRAIISSANRNGVVLESEADKLVETVESIANGFADSAVSHYEAYEKAYPKQDKKPPIEKELEKAQTSVSEAIKAYLDTPFREVS